MASADVEYHCFVGGLAWATDSRSLEQAFSAYGEVLDSKIINVRETGRSRGFGFMTFGMELAMKDAIEGMNGENLDRRSITVYEAQSRSGDGGRGGFRSGGGGYDNGSGPLKAADTAMEVVTTGTDTRPRVRGWVRWRELEELRI